MEPRRQRAGAECGAISLSHGYYQEPCLQFSPSGAWLGTHAEFAPRARFTIRSFAAEEFPNVVTDVDVDVVALFAKRTFWEKATILRAEYYRPSEKPILERYSRHYNDLATLAQGPIRAEALADMPLLAQVVRHVVRHKETFYPAAGAQYARAGPGSLRLLPGGRQTAAAVRQNHGNNGGA
jgi:Nucleotidyl transferase AbiEii toxin, Type IV TA system